MPIETVYGEEKPSYYVIREGGRAPTFRHTSRYNAEKEAERLAKKTPGATFHVLKLKKSLINTDASPDEHARQWELVGKLNEGDRVRISPTHYAYPNQYGQISKIELTGASPTVWVYLAALNDRKRFSPSSVNVVREPTA